MIQEIPLAQAEESIRAYSATPRRPIRTVHTHHTFLPNKGMWRGLPTVVGMRDYHVHHNGWADIAQHWTVGPDGSVWTGRPYDRIPASQSNFNSGALMYEMVGDFDAGHEVLEGPQLFAAVSISAAVLACFRLPLSAVLFHRELHLPGRPEPKTCPGTGVDKAAFCQLVERHCWERWEYDPPGGDTMQHVLAAYDPGEQEGTSDDLSPEVMVAYLDRAGDTALA